MIEMAVVIIGSTLLMLGFMEYQFRKVPQRTQDYLDKKRAENESRK